MVLLLIPFNRTRGPIFLKYSLILGGHNDVSRTAEIDVTLSRHVHAIFVQVLAEESTAQDRSSDHYRLAHRAVNPLSKYNELGETIRGNHADGLKIDNRGSCRLLWVTHSGVPSPQ